MLLVIAPPTRSAGDDPECQRTTANDYVRFDDSVKRVYIVPATKIDVTESDLMLVLRRTERVVAQCRSYWGSDWSISVFSDERYATFKDNPKIKDYVTDGRWAAGYLAEYAYQFRFLTMWPEVPEKRKESILFWTE
jgi:hypothetical protein